MVNNNFPQLTDLDVELMPLGSNASFGYRILPPRKSSKGNFYPLLNTRTYNTNSYSNISVAGSANVRSRVFGYIQCNNWGGQQGGFSQTSVVFSVPQLPALKNWVNQVEQQLANIQNDLYVNNAVNNSYQNLVLQTPNMIGQNAVLYFKPNVWMTQSYNGKPGVPITGFTMAVGSPEYTSNISWDAFLGFLDAIKTFDITKLSSEGITQFMIAEQKVMLDALMSKLSNGGGMPFNNGGYQPNNGYQSNNSNPFNNNNNNNNSFSNNNGNMNNSNPFANNNTTFGDNAMPFPPKNNNNNPFGNGSSNNTTPNTNNNPFQSNTAFNNAMPTNGNTPNKNPFAGFGETNQESNTNADKSPKISKPKASDVKPTKISLDDLTSQMSNEGGLSKPDTNTEAPKKNSVSGQSKNNSSSGLMKSLSDSAADNDGSEIDFSDID